MNKDVKSIDVIGNVGPESCEDYPSAELTVLDQSEQPRSKICAVRIALGCVADQEACHIREFGLERLHRADNQVLALPRLQVSDNTHQASRSRNPKLTSDIFWRSRDLECARIQAVVNRHQVQFRKTMLAEIVPHRIRHAEDGGHTPRQNARGQ